MVTEQGKGYVDHVCYRVPTADDQSITARYMYIKEDDGAVFGSRGEFGECRWQEK
jgi:hypothetical protein